MNLPKVSIVIPSYREKTRPYLDLCMKAIKNLNYPKELIDTVIVTPSNYNPLYSNANVIHHPDDNRNFSQAVNYGIRHSDQSSKHILLLSDDTVPTRDCLINMVTQAKDHDLIMAATSNCDNDWKYSLVFTVEKNGEFKKIPWRFFKIEDMLGEHELLMNARSIYPDGLIFTDLICFYACLIPRTTYAQIGSLDEHFNTGYEDSDYCQRAGKLGIRVVISLNSLIYHFGGRTTSELNTTEQAERNGKLYHDKWFK